MKKLNKTLRNFSQRNNEEIKEYSPEFSQRSNEEIK